MYCDKQMHKVEVNNDKTSVHERKTEFQEVIWKDNPGLARLSSIKTRRPDSKKPNLPFFNLHSICRQ